MKNRLMLCLCTLLMACACLVLASCACQHEYGEPDIVQATCTEDGVYVFTCLKCSAQATLSPEADDLAMQKRGHRPDGGVITTAPTCTTDGVRTFTCTLCETVTDTEVIPAAGHSIRRKQFESNGTRHWNTCSTCGEKANEEACDYTTIALDEQTHALACALCATVKEGTERKHSLGAATVTKAPTCQKVGYKTATCEVCLFEVPEEIPTAGHSFDTTTYVSAEGKHWFACSDCGAVDQSSVVDCTLDILTETLPAAGSCVPGERTAACTVCKTTYTDIIPADAAHVLTDATYDSAAMTVSFTCERCHTRYVIRGANALINFETPSTTNGVTDTAASDTAWRTYVAGEAGENHYVVCQSNEIYNDKNDGEGNGVAYRLSGPFTGMDTLTTYILDFDIKLHENGLSGAASLSAKGATTGWFKGNTLLTVNPNGSLSGNVGQIAPAGTVTKEAFTHVTIAVEVATGNVQYYIDGNLVSTATSNTLKGQSIAYVNVIIPAATKNEHIGSGICLDNMSLGSGGVALLPAQD